jgi:hypothetical protein
MPQEAGSAAPNDKSKSFPDEGQTQEQEQQPALEKPPLLSDEEMTIELEKRRREIRAQRNSTKERIHA